MTTMVKGLSSVLCVLVRQPCCVYWLDAGQGKQSVAKQRLDSPGNTGPAIARSGTGKVLIC